MSQAEPDGPEVEMTAVPGIISRRSMTGALARFEIMLDPRLTENKDDEDDE
ncbi:hypothetical protein [Brachybacterium hainanense]|uniref:Uncharacterized protein n=1 Tax=Brachybacterium hainanense TaxID=1541174 RepID=A0ABV6RC87_9MICO